MNDLMDVKKDYKSMTEPLWLKNTKIFLRGFWDALKLVLLALYLIAFFYLLVWGVYLLDDGKEFNKEIKSNSHYEKAYNISGN